MRNHSVLKVNFLKIQQSNWKTSVSVALVWYHLFVNKEDFVRLIVIKQAWDKESRSALFLRVTPVFSVKDTAAVERNNVLMWIVGHKIILVTAWDRCRRIYVRAGQWDHSFVICGVLCNPRSIHWTMHCDEMLLFTFRWSQSEKRALKKVLS